MFFFYRLSVPWRFKTDVHSDGWGIAFFENKGVRQFLDPQPSATSAIAEFVKSYPIKSQNVIAHIRKATQGVVSLENTHPFQREMWGHYWVFAHNGNLENFQPEFDGSFIPVGNTDSERIFCWIMQSLRKRFGSSYPDENSLFDYIHSLALELASQGEVNFLFSNGNFLICHCSTKLSYIVRKAPFTQARLKDQDLTVDFKDVTTANDKVAVIATIPLTDNEAWETLQPGTLALFRDGDLQEKRTTKEWIKTK
nr:class II glutamine amidotransferase [Pseudobdellovibrio exovorus]